MLVAVVALLVIGPDRLPKVARTLGAYSGRLQRYISQVKEEVNREMNFEDLQAMQQDIQAGVDKAKSSIRDGISQVSQAADEVEHTITRREDIKSTVAKAEKKQSVKKKSLKKPATKKTTTNKPQTNRKVVKKTAVKKTKTANKPLESDS